MSVGIVRDHGGKTLCARGLAPFDRQLSQVKVTFAVR